MAAAWLNTDCISTGAQRILPCSSRRYIYRAVLKVARPKLRRCLESLNIADDEEYAQSFLMELMSALGYHTEKHTSRNRTGIYICVIVHDLTLQDVDLWRESARKDLQSQLNERFGRNKIGKVTLDVTELLRLLSTRREDTLSTF